MTDDGGAKPEDTDNPGTTPPPAVVPGDSTGGFGSAGTTGSTAAGAAATGGAGGAGGSASAPTPERDGGLDGGEDNGDALFEGLWVIDQPSHGLYEATLYELAAGGELSALEAMPLGYVTGTVANSAGSVRCQFAGQWRSLGERSLELDATCDDATPRTVQLQLPADQDVTTGVVPDVLSVGGETDWDHHDWPWSWRKCPSRDACPPF